MKKFIQLILSFVVAFILLGCSSEVTVQYESANFTKITYTYDKKTDVITKFKIENRTEVPDEEEAEKVKQFFKELELLDGIKTTASEKYLIVDTSLIMQRMKKRVSLSSLVSLFKERNNEMTHG